MNKNIKSLEDLVSRAGRRIRQLSEERERLEEQLSMIDHQPTVRIGSDSEPDPEVDRAEIVATLRQALTDLRGAAS